MKLRVNGEEKEFADVHTVADLLERMQIDASKGGVAVAVNNQVVTRARIAEAPVADGDRIEIVHAVQGG
ncbi:MAG: sulfur carrier protein ThiS [Candidatus Eisenbacteria bacterium]|uniref:Sulfur carrier protein ThiS n=1 Tax=Eiseniibacteriota bacterium TaxID=2212470 RepID=A0A956SFH8_UNCEI|nr:sulfur carrier protein ThiS [Candidatus Eisenbacteria bacterium]MCB9465403.1 sulfur carrier protein ThiS [Candidatus Eisenbacteria bacterium]